MLEDGDTSDGADIVRAYPQDCKAIIIGHKRTYAFTNLVPILGFSACSSIRENWEAIYENVTEETAFNEFRVFRRMLHDIGLDGRCSDDVFQALSTGSPVSQRDFQNYIEALRKRILDPADASFTNAGRSSAIKYLEALRNCLRRFADAGVLPAVELSLAGMYDELDEVRSPCFATLAMDAGRLTLIGDNDYENSVKFHRTNRDLLLALRKSLVDVFQEGQRMVNEGRRILNNPNLPPLPKIVQAIKDRAKLHGAKARAERGFAGLLEGSIDYVRGIAILIFRGLYRRGGTRGVSRNSLRSFLEKAGGVKLISKMAEPCSATLMAATIIVQIDTGWESSTVLNMDFDPFVGKITKNRITVRAIVSRKDRAGGKLRNAALIEDEDSDDLNPDVDVSVSVKERGNLTGYQVIRAYQDMTAHIRSEFPAAKAKKLWLSRGARTINMVIYLFFRQFLSQNSQHPEFGGLPLTRRSIKRTKYNVDAHSTIGNIGLARAKGDQSSDKLAFAYLSAPAVRGIFKHKIREYLEHFEAVVYSSVDELAVKIGIPSDVLERRKALGIENGLLELLADTDDVQSDPSQGFDARAKTLKPNDSGLRSLVIAGYSIDARWKEMSAKNPQRFLRTWVPWMALIRAMVIKIRTTRHRVRFRKILDDVRREIAEGTTFLLAVW